MLKKLLSTLFVLFFAFSLAADFAIPPIREINSVKIVIRPEKVGEKVKFSFDKQDLNGYIGTDAVVFTITSPSGSTACEVLAPDDGDDKVSWKTGPRIRVDMEFTAQEKGDYIFTVNTTSSVDLMLLFDRAEVKNAFWGFDVGKMRFAGRGKHNDVNDLDVYILLPPKQAGESQKKSFQLCTVKTSKVENLTVSAAGKTLLAPSCVASLPKMQYSMYTIERIDGVDVYRFQAEKFSQVVRLIFPGHGNYMLFADQRSAEAFAGKSSLDTPYFSLKTPAVYPPAALQNSGRYLINFIPDAAGTNFDFPVVINGKNYRFSAEKKSEFFSVPADKTYLAIDFSKALPGKMEFFLISDTPKPLAPASGIIADSSKTILNWSITGAPEYEISFLNLSTGEKFSGKSAENRFALNSVNGKFTPGVWQWQVSAGKVKGAAAFFIIPEKSPTMMAYCYDFVPAMDTTVKTVPAELAFRVALLKVDDIDFDKSFILVNNKKYPLKRLSSTRVECPVKPEYAIGRNQIKAVVVSKSGIRSVAHWGFFLGQANDRPIFTTDDRGNIFCNGTPYFPVIYYGYASGKSAVERSGFNVVLLNTLTSAGMLNKLLNRNLKTIDSGSVFRGIYSKDKTVAGAEKDVQNYVKTAPARHQARMAAWMDEMDVHRSADYIRKFLALFGSQDESGWRGVCSCNRILYGTMADMGDYLMIDHYASGSRVFSLDKAIQAGRSAAKSKALMVLLQGFSGNDPTLSGFTPSALDVEYSAFSALRNRANAIGLYQCGQYRLECYPENWKHAISVYRKLYALSHIAYGKDLENFIKTAENSPIRFRTIEFEGNIYIIAQNCSFEPQAVKLVLNEKFSGKVKVLFEDRQISAENGIFTDAFSTAGTRIYVLAK